MSAWIDRGSGPVLLASVSSPLFLGPANLDIAAAQLYDGHTALDLRFDNLNITADTIVPEPTTLSALILGCLFMFRNRRNKFFSL